MKKRQKDSLERMIAAFCEKMGIERQDVEEFDCATQLAWKNPETGKWHKIGQENWGADEFVIHPEFKP